MVTAGELLAHAAMNEQKYFQSFPDFGAERSGAPVAAYTRLSSEPIDVQSAVTKPDIVVVLDSTLLGLAGTFQGLPQHSGLVMVNSPLSPEDLQISFCLQDLQVCTVDATRIAGELLSRNLPNVPMLGALVRITGLVSAKEMMRAIQERLGKNLPGKLTRELTRANLMAFKRGYREARSAAPEPASVFDDSLRSGLKTLPEEYWPELPAGAMVTSPGSSVEIDTGTWRAGIPRLDLEKCTHCMICWIFCPDDSILVEDQRVQGIDLMHCKGCGICALECPVGAIAMEGHTT